MLYTVTWLTVTEKIISGRSSPLIPTENHLCVSSLWIILVLKVCMLSRVDWSELLHKEQVTAKATYMTLLLEKQYFRGQSQQMACSFEVFLLKGENNEMIRSAFIRDVNYVSLKRWQPTEKWTRDKDDQAYSVPPWGIYQWIGDNLGLHIQLT